MLFALSGLLFRGSVFNQSKKLGAFFKGEDAPGFETSIVCGAAHQNTVVSASQINELTAAGAFRRWQVLRTIRELREINDNFVDLFLCGHTALAGFLVDDDFARRLVLLFRSIRGFGAG